MKRLIFSTLVIAMTFNVYAQKKKVSYDKETGMIEVNGEAYAKLTKENAPGQLGINKNYTISNLEGKELIYMVFKQKVIRDLYGNEKEKKTYYLISFLESNRSSARNGTLTAKGAAKIVVKNNLIVDGKIDPEAEKKFHIKY